MSWYDHRLDSAAALRDVVPPPRVSAHKVLDRLDEHCLRFVRHATLVMVASWSADGHADVSPKGDPAGFIEVVDDRTLAIPDRPGNGRIDTFLNVVESTPVGLLLLVPGLLETCRISGRGAVTTDPELLDRMSVRGRRPKLALVVEVEEAMVHCGKALRRGAAWEPDRGRPDEVFPTMGQMLHDHARPREVSREQLSRLAADDLHNNMY